MSKVRVFVVGGLEPVPYDIPNGPKGVSYKISLILADTKETGEMKVGEDLYKAIVEQTSFMDQIDLVMKPRFIMSVQNGRAVRELKFMPDTFEFVAALGASAPAKAPAVKTA